ncbi:MAG: replication initiation protein [Gammaproteobacteria bacterium]
MAADRAYDQTKTVLPSEVAQGVYMQHAPSLKALKLMHLMIGTAGGRMADPVRHTIRLSDVKKIDGMANHSRQTVAPLFAELRAATMTTDDPEKKRMVIGGLLDVATIDYRHEVSGDTLITWSFGGMFIDMARDSNHWAILDRQAVFHLGSKYSVLLFQHIASLQNLKHVTSKRFSVAELRAVFGIPEGTMPRFANLKARAISPAIAEINSDLTRLHLTATYHKVGRTVAEVEIAWEVKEDLAKVKAELDRPKVGRKARAEGSEDQPVLAFPKFGSVKGTQPWGQIARDHAPRIEGRHVPDLRVLADTFRKWCDDKSIPLDMRNIDKTFTTWCKSYSVR